MSDKRAFTLIELVIVIMIIGVLAAIGIPQYAKSLEKARATDARVGISQIYRAELEYAANRAGIYTDSIEDLSDVALSERFWTFSIDTPTSTSFTAIATRTSGKCNGQTISMDQDGILSGNWEYL